MTFRNRAVAWIGLAAVTILAGLAWTRTSFDGSMARLFPRNGWFGKTFQLFAELPAAEKAVVSISAPTPFTEQEQSVLDAFARKHSSQNAFSEETLATGLSQIADSLPLFVLPQTLSGTDFSDEGIALAARRNRLALLKPESLFAARLLACDPFGLLVPFLAKLRSLPSLMPWDVHPDASGRLLSQDACSRLVPIDANASPADRTACAKFVADISQEISELRRQLPRCSIEAAGGQFHTVSNEETTRRDLARSGTLAGVLLLVVFAVFFRDWRVVFAAAIPFLALFLAIPFSSFCMGPLCFLVPAFAPILAGLTADYALHIHLALRAGRSLRPLFFPVFSGFVTTLCVFASFAFSTMPGFRQLAFFSCLALCFSFAGAFVLLPLLEGKRGAQTETSVSSGKTSRQGLLLFPIALALLFVVARRVEFSLDLSDLDGSSAQVKNEEAAIKKRWSSHYIPPFFAVMPRDDAKLQELSQRFPQGLFRLDFFPPSERVVQWNSFWEDRATTVSNSFAKASAALGFSPEAFSEFWSKVPSGICEQPKCLQPLAPMFGTEKLDLFFPMTEVSGEKETGAFYVDMENVSAKIRTAFAEDLRVVGVVALCSLLVCSAILLRSPTRFFRVLFPPAAGLLGIFASGQCLNLMHAAAMLLVLGICWDYGVFLDSALREGSVRATRRSVSLCWLTTIAGASPLMFAEHPALRSIGFALAIGITCGWLAAMLASISIPFLPLLLCGCTSTAPLAPSPLNRGEIAFPYGEKKLTGTIVFSSRVQFSVFGKSFLSLCQTKVDFQKGTFVATGLSPAGATLFRVEGNSSSAECTWIAPPLLSVYANLGKCIAQDIQVFFLKPSSVETGAFTTFENALLPLSLVRRHPKFHYVLQMEHIAMSRE